MKFTKPAWVQHTDPNKDKSDHSHKHLPIFSVHVHPDGSRIATGGMDAKVRIWSTKPILNASSELSNRPPKSLSTLSMHTGPVLCVRWAHSGRWLASGSDDEVVMIWDLDPSAKGKVWGSDDINVEGWKPLKRLPGHESDVTDIAWSPNDRYLASVALDSKCIIWCGYTLERLQKLDQHQGFVKGVCWDPVGEFLATQSDDKSVKIWRTSDWSLEAEVRKPFEDSPGSTFFRRLSWSPDGAHITASNATNNQGFVFIAAVITRNSWTSEISLVGHENTVEVATYNPHIFLRDPSQSLHTSNICSVVALGADDRSVSVWQTKSARPLIVAKEVFERQIMDLAWSWDGLALYAVSSDGTLAAFSFSSDEMEGLAPHSTQKEYLKRFDFRHPELPSNFSHIGNPLSANATATATAAAESVKSQASINGFTGEEGDPQSPGGERINKLVAKRKPKGGVRRIQPTYLGGLGGKGPSGVNVVPSASLDSPVIPPSSDIVGMGFGGGQSSSSRGPLVGPGMGASSVDFGGGGMGGMDIDADINVHVDSFETGTAFSSSTSKRKHGDMIGGVGVDERPGKARTLGGDRAREGPVAVKRLNYPSSSVPLGPPASMGRAGGRVLEVPSVVNYLSVRGTEGMETDAVFEGKNAESGTVNEVAYVVNKQTQWLDFLPSPSLALTASNVFTAVAMLDGCVNVYSLTGRRLMPTLTLDSPVSFLSSSKAALIAITSNGTLYSWNVKKSNAIHPPASLLPLLSQSPNSSSSGIPQILTSLSARPNGSPIIHTTSGIAYSYDSSLMSFVKLSEPWWAQGSDAWSGRQRSSQSFASSSSSSNASGLQQQRQQVVTNVESVIAETMKTGGIGVDDGSAQRPEWWNTALTFGHLESKMHAAKVLEGGIGEYKQVLLVYAKKIADEGFRGKAEELVKELFGPVYWRPGMAKEDGWAPTVLGTQKRDLLREVLNIFARSKTLTKLAMDWQDLLRKASTSVDD